jgi:hypothetical protein
MFSAFSDFLGYLIYLAITNFETWIGIANGFLSAHLDATWDNIFTSITTIIMPFATLIIGICLLIELAQVAAKVETIKWEYGIKLGFKMAMSVALLNILPVFLQACYLQAAAWINTVAGFGTGIEMGSLYLAQIGNMVDSVSGWSVFGLFISTVVLVLAFQICGIIIMAIAFGRMFEIYVYLAISPIPAAFFPLGDGTGGGFSRITMKFLRSFAAVCLQGVIMMICLRIFGLLVDTTLNEAFEANIAIGGAAGVTQVMLTFVLGAITLVIAIVKSGSWAKSVLDAV